MGELVFLRAFFRQNIAQIGFDLENVFVLAPFRISHSLFPIRAQKPDELTTRISIQSRLSLFGFVPSALDAAQGQDAFFNLAAVKFGHLRFSIVTRRWKVHTPIDGQVTLLRARNLIRALLRLFGRSILFSADRPPQFL